MARTGFSGDGAPVLESQAQHADGSAHREWAFLHPELLCLLLADDPDASLRRAARAVCNNWRATVDSKLITQLCCDIEHLGHISHLSGLRHVIVEGVSDKLCGRQRMQQRLWAHARRAAASTTTRSSSLGRVAAFPSPRGDLSPLARLRGVQAVTLRCLPLLARSVQQQVAHLTHLTSLTLHQPMYASMQFKGLPEALLRLPQLKALALINVQESAVEDVLTQPKHKRKAAAAAAAAEAVEAAIAEGEAVIAAAEAAAAAAASAEVLAVAAGDVASRAAEEAVEQRGTAGHWVCPTSSSGSASALLGSRSSSGSSWVAGLDASASASQLAAVGGGTAAVGGGTAAAGGRTAAAAAAGAGPSSSSAAELDASASTTSLAAAEATGTAPSSSRGGGGFPPASPLPCPWLGNLSSLTIRSTDLPDLRPALASLTSCTSLDLRHCSLEADLPSSLSQLTQLKALDLSYCYGSRRLPKSCWSSLTALTRLCLSGDNMVGVSHVPIKQLPSLQHLELQDQRLRTQSLLGCTALQVLDARGCEMRKPAVDTLGTVLRRQPALTKVLYGPRCGLKMASLMERHSGVTWVFDPEWDAPYGGDLGDLWSDDDERRSSSSSSSSSSSDSEDEGTDSDSDGSSNSSLSSNARGDMVSDSSDEFGSWDDFSSNHESDEDEDPEEEEDAGSLTWDELEAMAFGPGEEDAASLTWDELEAMVYGVGLQAGPEIFPLADLETDSDASSYSLSEEDPDEDDPWGMAPVRGGCRWSPSEGFVEHAPVGPVLRTYSDPMGPQQAALCELLPVAAAEERPAPQQQQGSRRGCVIS